MLHCSCNAASKLIMCNVWLTVEEISHDAIMQLCLEAKGTVWMTLDHLVCCSVHGCQTWLFPLCAAWLLLSTWLFCYVIYVYRSHIYTYLCVCRIITTALSNLWHTHSLTGLFPSGAVPCLSSPRQPLFMSSFDSSEPDSFAAWARNAMQRAGPGSGRLCNGVQTQIKGLQQLR